MSNIRILPGSQIDPRGMLLKIVEEDGEDIEKAFVFVQRKDGQFITYATHGNAEFIACTAARSQQLACEAVERQGLEIT